MIGSHTVPQSLLRKFAYFDQHTNASWLWRYARGRPPYPRASPKSSTRHFGHFVDPENPQAEAEIEKQLANEYEHPVNQFVHLLSDPNFMPTDERRKQLTRYVTLLFLRSKSRREGTKHLQEVKRHAWQQFLNNRSQLLTVATNWNIDLICQGRRMSRPFSPEDVATSALKELGRLSEAEAEQQQYLVGIRNGMANMDETMYRGDWRLIETTSDRPFIISDSPVVTWQRDDKGTIHHGGGFWRQNIEVLLPVSPSACLHILPDVERNVPVTIPSVDEVNIAQAAFAYRDCFTNVKNGAIDALVQREISTARIGHNVFTVWHRNYSEQIYRILMNRGQWVEPPRL